MSFNLSQNGLNPIDTIDGAMNGVAQIEQQIKQALEAFKAKPPSAADQIVMQTMLGIYQNQLIAYSNIQKVQIDTIKAVVSNIGM
ncbi:MAG TPA: hypothetical protein PKD00_07840 [Burkholderiales bacterium]|mgnify:CR=1 FL=1|nr:hypothetical protein [Burkholderiales bacterium]